MTSALTKNQKSTKNQKTILREFCFEGIGVHQGIKTKVVVKPLPSSSGLVFQRKYPEGGDDGSIVKAVPAEVVASPLATTLGSGRSAIMTVEHFLAAVFALDLDNLFVEVHGAEMPILDGSAKTFIDLFQRECGGVLEQEAPKQALFLKSSFCVFDEKDKTKFIELSKMTGAEPKLKYFINFSQNPHIGEQTAEISYTPEAFFSDASFARTFCTEEEISYMRSQGLALGGSLDNAIVVSKENGVLNQGGLRDPQEIVKHKILDFIGDLQLLGLRLMADVFVSKGGHALHNKLARAIIEQPEYFEKSDL